MNSIDNSINTFQQHNLLSPCLKVLFLQPYPQSQPGRRLARELSPFAGQCY